MSVRDKLTIDEKCRILQDAKNNLQSLQANLVSVHKIGYDLDGMELLRIKADMTEKLFYKVASEIKREVFGKEPVVESYQSWSLVSIYIIDIDTSGFENIEQYLWIFLCEEHMNESLSLDKMDKLYKRCLELSYGTK